MPGLTMIMSPEQDSTYQLPSSMSVNDVADRLTSMQQQESTYRCRDYIIDAAADDVSTCSSNACCNEGPQEQRIIDQDCRSKMVEWSYQVSDFCNFQRETVSMAMNYLDRFLSTASPRAHQALCDKKEFQLVAMTSLYIAIKLFEPLAMDPGLLVHISHGCYTETDIVEMEEEILKSLQWRVNGPTTHAFLNHIMALLPPSAYRNDETTAANLLDFSRFQAEIAVSDYDLSLEKTSTVALASILNSLECIEKRSFPARSRFQFFRLIADVTGMNPFSPEVNAARTRLLELFSKNSGYDLPQIANLTPVTTPAEQCPSHQKLSNQTRHNTMASSPVCVACVANCA